MDHILEHEGQPVPDLNAVTQQSSTSTSAPMDVDADDEDIEALKSLGVLKGDAGATGEGGDAAEAKVSDEFELQCPSN